MELPALRNEAILGLKDLSLKELKEKRKRLEEEMQKMKLEGSAGKSDSADVADACLFANMRSRTFSLISSEIEKLVGAQGCLDLLIAENNQVIGIWSLVQVEYEDTETEETVTKFYLISPIMPGAVAFEDSDIKVYVVTPNSDLGRQMIGEGVDASVICKTDKTSHSGTIIGFA